MSQRNESNGATKATVGAGSGGASSAAVSVAGTNRLPRIPSTAIGTSSPRSTSSAWSDLRTSGLAMRANVPPAPPAPSRPWAGGGRVACAAAARARGSSGRAARRQEPLDEVVVAAVAVAAREPDHAGDRVRLEHRAHGVLGQAEPVLRRAALLLEVGGGKRAFGADPLEHLLGDRGVLLQRGRVEARPLAAGVHAVPRKLVRRDERERLVRRLEDLSPLVEVVAPGGRVAVDARVQHQVVVAPGDRDRVELDRAELSQDGEHRRRLPRQRPRRTEEGPPGPSGGSPERGFHA